LIVGGESGTDLKLDNCWRATEEVGEVWVEGEGGCKGCEAWIAGLRVEDPASVRIEEEGKRGELGHVP